MIASTTAILFLESLMFLLLNLPFDLYYIDSRVPHQGSCHRIIKSVADLLQCTSGALNFALYMLTGRKFRMAFLKTIRAQKLIALCKCKT